MFTGLVETTGRVRSITRTGDGARLTVEAPFARDLSRGESVAVNGVCLTVVGSRGGGFEADTVAETLRATTLGALTPGSRVNLERALRLGDRLGGHIVTGHVDGVARVAARRDRRTGTELTFELPEDLLPEVVTKGSIAIDGTSLTVASVLGRLVTVALIPETLTATISGGYRTGALVNVETDVLAKHLRQLVATGGGRAAREGGRRKEEAAENGAEAARLTFERLRELGF